MYNTYMKTNEKRHPEKNKGKTNERKSFLLKYCYLWFVFEIIESVFLHFVFNSEKFVLRKEIFRRFVCDFQFTGPM